MNMEKKRDIAAKCLLGCFIIFYILTEIFAASKSLDLQATLLASSSPYSYIINLKIKNRTNLYKSTKTIFQNVSSV